MELLDEGQLATMENLLAALRFRLLFDEFWHSSLKALSQQPIVVPNVPNAPSSVNYQTLLCQVCANLRDSNQPTPKIFSIRTMFEKYGDEIEGKDAAKAHTILTRRLCIDPKVNELIQSYNIF